MANNPAKWSTPEPAHLVIDITSNLTDGSNVVGGSTDASGFIYSAWEIGISGFHTAPTAGNSVDLYFVPVSQDGGGVDTDGSASVDPPANDYVGSFPMRNVATAQRVPTLHIINPPYNFTPLLINNTGQTIPGGSGTLRMQLYTQQVVT